MRATCYENRSPARRAMWKPLGGRGTSPAKPVVLPPTLCGAGAPRSRKGALPTASSNPAGRESAARIAWSERSEPQHGHRLSSSTLWILSRSFVGVRFSRPTHTSRERWYLTSCFKKMGTRNAWIPKTSIRALGEGRAVSPKPPPPGALGERALPWMIHRLLERLSDF
jgi:hypothetical protein